MPIFTKSDYSRVLRLANRTTRQPIDLTGFAFELVVKAKRDDAQPLASLMLGAGLAVTDCSSGCVSMALTALQTSAIGAGDRFWALYRTDGGRRLCLASGKMIVREGV